MNRPTVLRTAAVLFADDNTIVSPRNIHKKIVESMFLNNNNAEMSIHELIDCIKTNLELLFDEKEINDLVNSKHGHFQVRYDAKTRAPHLRLVTQRFTSLQQRAETNNLSAFVSAYVSKHYIGELAKDKIEDVLYRFLYELLNKNINAFRKIIANGCKANEISVDSSQFTPSERQAINGFIDWDNPDKNKALYSLISYAVEYGLISNNVTANPHLGSLKKKYFYLDNNVVYRAIGINGDDRKNRIRDFLRQCINNGQSLLISKYTRQEFKETVKHHLANLQKVPFRKINPRLFSQYAVNPGFYEFYHRWRDGRTSYGFTNFSSHIDVLYDQLLETFNITEDFRDWFDESDSSVNATIDKYAHDIEQFKRTSQQKSHRFDALNTYLVETKRGNHKITIAETKYYFVSVDQRLRDWDFNRNDCQPIALLPSQWMTILLRYFSRSDDDYKSLVGFLKLRQEKSLLEEEQLQYVVAGISETTEDFEKQTTIFEKMVENKFEGILDQQDPAKIANAATKFARKTLDVKISKIKEEAEEDLRRVQADHEKEKRRFQQQLLDEAKTSINNLLNLRDISDREVVKRNRNHLFLLSLPIIVYILIMSLLIHYVSWNIIEPIVFIFSPLVLLGHYVYFAITGKSFDFRGYFLEKRSEIQRQVYKQNRFDEQMLDSVIARRDELQETLDSQIERR